MESILSIKNLHKRYGFVHAVNGISLEIKKGNVYGILGPNGSGKSTTLGIVLNVVNKTSGEFTWFDGSQSTHEAIKKVGAIIERPNFYPYMTAAENLSLVCKIKGISKTKVAEKLEIVGLTERRNSKFRTFSLGMKQRLAIASALLNDPEILILDEPTNGLDPQGIHPIREIIRLIASTGTTILLASHLLDEVEKVCSHVLVLKKGQMLYSGTVSDMIRSEGFFELAANDLVELERKLRLHPYFKSVESAQDKLVFTTSTTIAAADLNQYLASENVFVSHLAFKKPSLEEQFLTLTKTANL